MIIYAIDDLCGLIPIYHLGYGATIVAYIKKRKRMIPSIENLDYVHGSMERLLTGKPCVVRNQIVALALDETTTIAELQEDEFISQRNLKDRTDKNFQVFKMQKIENDKKPFAQVKEGRLIRIGKTTNGNSVVILR
jgi:hypothetical protein